MAQHALGVTGAASASATRTAVELYSTVPSPISGAMVTPKPSSRPSAASVAALPLRLQPKQKSAPTATWRAPNRAPAPHGRNPRARGRREPRPRAARKDDRRPAAPAGSRAIPHSSAERAGGPPVQKNSRGCSSKVMTPRRVQRRARGVDHRAVPQMRAVEIAHGDCRPRASGSRPFQS